MLQIRASHLVTVYESTMQVAATGETDCVFPAVLSVCDYTWEVTPKIPEGSLSCPDGALLSARWPARAARADWARMMTSRWVAGWSRRDGSLSRQLRQDDDAPIGIGEVRRLLSPVCSARGLRTRAPAASTRAMAAARSVAYR